MVRTAHPRAIQQTGRLRTRFIGAGAIFLRTLGITWSGISPLTTSADARLRRPVGLTAVRCTDVFAFEPGPASWKHAPPPSAASAKNRLGEINQPLLLCATK